MTNPKKSIKIPAAKSLTEEEVKHRELAQIIATRRQLAHGILGCILQKEGRVEDPHELVIYSLELAEDLMYESNNHPFHDRAEA